MPADVIQLTPRSAPIVAETPETLAAELERIAGQIRAGVCPAKAVCVMVWQPGGAHLSIGLGCSVLEHIGLLEIAKRAVLDEVRP